MKPLSRFLITFATIAFLSTLAGCIAYDLRATEKRTKFFREQEENRLRGIASFSGPYCHPDPHPLVVRKIAFLAGMTLLLMVVFQNPVWATLGAILTFSRFPIWYLETRSLLKDWEFYRPEGFDLLLINAGVFDLISGVISASLVLSLLAATVAWSITQLKNRKLP